MQVSRWAAAFLVTQLVEGPIYAWVLRERFPKVPARVAAALGASAITHPMVWFVIPYAVSRPYLLYLAVAETFAVVVEAIYLQALGAKHPFAWSLCANASSVGVALVTRWLFDFP